MRDRAPKIPYLIDAKSDKKTDLRSEIADLQQQLHHQKQQLTQIDLHIADLAEPIDNGTYKTDLAKYKRDLDTTATDLKAANKNLKLIEHELQSKQSNYESLIKELESFDWESQQISGKSLKTKYDLLEHRIEDSRYELRRKEAEYDTARESVQDILDRKSSLIKPVDDGVYSKEYSKYLSKREALKEARTNTVNEIKILADSIDTKKSEIKEINKNITSLRNEQESLQASIPDTEKKIVSSQSALDEHLPLLLEETCSNLEAATNAYNQALHKQHQHDSFVESKIQEAIKVFESSSLVTSGYFSAVMKIYELNDVWDATLSNANNRGIPELKEHRKNLEKRLDQHQQDLNNLSSSHDAKKLQIEEEFVNSMKSINSEIDIVKVKLSNEYCAHIRRHMSAFTAYIDYGIPFKYFSFEKIALTLPWAFGAFGVCAIIGTYLLGPQFSEEVASLFWVTTSIIVSLTAIISYIVSILNRDVFVNGVFPLEGEELANAQKAHQDFRDNITNLESDFINSSESLSKKVETIKFELLQNFRKIVALSNKKIVTSFRPYSVPDTNTIQQWIYALAMHFVKKSEVDLPLLFPNIFELETPPNQPTQLLAIWKQWYKSNQPDISFVKKYETINSLNDLLS